MKIGDLIEKLQEIKKERPNAQVFADAEYLDGGDEYQYGLVNGVSARTLNCKSEFWDGETDENGEVQAVILHGC